MAQKSREFAASPAHVTELTTLSLRICCALGSWSQVQSYANTAKQQDGHTAALLAEFAVADALGQFVQGHHERAAQAFLDIPLNAEEHAAHLLTAEDIGLYGGYVATSAAGAFGA